MTGSVGERCDEGKASRSPLNLNQVNDYYYIRLYKVYVRYTYITDNKYNITEAHCVVSSSVIDICIMHQSDIS